VLRWALPLAVVLAIVAAVSLGVALRSSKAEPSAVSTVEPASASAAATWKSGELRAPAFALRGEDGRPLSLASLRGRPVLITFIDPLCRNLCPTEAQHLSDVVRGRPADEKPFVVAVSVNPAGGTRQSLALDRRRWKLPPQWRWAVGDRRALARVWRRYHIQVLIQEKTIAGVRTQQVSHTEAAYLVDADGYQRALFLWPYTPAAVTRALRATSTGQ
jgi:cytochrome oxidase Cu insertion factor (SCO1/SenC/PrrC family)